MTIERFKEVFQKAGRRAEHDRKMQGQLGRYNGSTWVIDVPGKVGYCYVTITQGGGSTTVVEALFNNSPRQGGRPVLLDELPSGELIITGGNPEQAIVYQGSSAGSVADVAYHGHGFGSGLEYEHPSLMFSPGRAYVVSGLVLYISPFHFRWSGVEYYWPGDNVNLSAYRPATSGHHGWVKVGINPSASPLAAVVTAGATQATTAPLTRDQLDDISFTSYIPVIAVKLTNGQTASPVQRPAANGGDIEDIRLWLSGTGGGSSSYPYTHPATLTNDVTIASGFNALLIGPVTFDGDLNNDGNLIIL